MDWCVAVRRVTLKRKPQAVDERHWDNHAGFLHLLLQKWRELYLALLRVEIRLQTNVDLNQFPNNQNVQ